MRNWLFVKLSKIDKPLTTLNRKNKEESETTNIYQKLHY